MTPVGGGNSNISLVFSPRKLGKGFPIWRIIFQWGCSHQLGISWVWKKKWWESDLRHESMFTLLDHFLYVSTNIWVFPKLGVPQNGWFIMENPNLGVPLFTETPIYYNAVVQSQCHKISIYIYMIPYTLTILTLSIGDRLCIYYIIYHPFIFQTIDMLYISPWWGHWSAAAHQLLWASHAGLDLGTYSGACQSETWLK